METTNHKNSGNNKIRILHLVNGMPFQFEKYKSAKHKSRKSQKQKNRNHESRKTQYLKHKNVKKNTKEEK